MHDLIVAASSPNLASMNIVLVIAIDVNTPDEVLSNFFAGQLLTEVVKSGLANIKEIEIYGLDGPTQVDLMGEKALLLDDVAKYMGFLPFHSEMVARGPRKYSRAVFESYASQAWVPRTSMGCPMM